jgi:rhamnogalacturonan endolyase
MRFPLTLVLAASTVGLFCLTSRAQEPVALPVLPDDQLPPAAKFAGPQDPDYVKNAPKSTAPRQVEKLGRGVVAVNQGEGKVWVSWRLTGVDPEEIAFNVYRSTEGGAPVKLNGDPIKNVTFFVDDKADLTKANAWYVRPVLNGKEDAAQQSKDFLNKLAANSTPGNWKEIPIQFPAGGRWTPGDASVGDLDGDGEYEIVLKSEQQPRDTASAGRTGDTILQGYKLDGKLLWTIHMGPNIREGAHYTQFMVYDFDGDGRAEIVTKTADGTIDGTGKVIGDPNANWWGSNNYIEDGPEYLTVFDGLTGKALDTVPYIPDRGEPRSWGGIGGNGGNDNGTNRRDRFTGTIAWLDGVHPSIVMGRGYYGRTVAAAWDFKGGKLVSRWVFDSGPSVNGEVPYAGQGAHWLTAADVDNDGRDEIVFHSMVIDDNGKGLYSTGFRHGDASHIGAFDPARPNDIEVFGIHENEGTTTRFGTPGVAMYNGKDGKTIWSADPAEDVGRGVAADIDPRYPGFEAWGGRSGLRSMTGERIGDQPASQNFTVYWDGDTGVELLDGNHIDKWNWETGNVVRLYTADGASANNGSKSNPAISADLFGDWREEVVWRATDNHCLYVCTTTVPTEHRIFTLMHDGAYRNSVASQNVAYNQPPHTGFYLGFETKFPVPRPNVVMVEPKPITPGVSTDRAYGPPATAPATPPIPAPADLLPSAPVATPAR